MSDKGFEDAAAQRVAAPGLLSTAVGAHSPGAGLGREIHCDQISAIRARRAPRGRVD